MRLSRDEVLHIAALARIGLSDDEIERLRGELGQILGHVDRLNELPTEGIPPTAQVLELEATLAPDEPRPSLARDAMLANAPDREGGLFRTPAVLGYET